MSTVLHYEDNWETERYALLNTRVCDIRLEFEGTLLQRCFEKIHHELDRKGMQFKPGHYFTCGGDEWGCPNRVPIIGIPFHQADNRLTRIEREMGYAAYDARDLTILLRHEAGHAFNYAYRLFDTDDWKSVFGDFEKHYPANFRFKFNTYSRNYVRSQGEPKYYAQAHPDEDFAETFAVWLTPRSNWRVEYKNWPCLQKLEYIDRTMKDLRRKKPLVAEGPLDSPYEKKTYLLIEYYGEDIDDFKDKALGIYDQDLKIIFAQAVNGNRRQMRARELIRKHRRFLIRTISQWTGAREKVVAPVIIKFLQRCRDLDLLVPLGEDAGCLASVTSLGTTVVMNYLHTGRYIAD